jgi:hypothetical protein
MATAITALPGLTTIDGDSLIAVENSSGVANSTTLADISKKQDGVFNILHYGGIPADTGDINADALQAAIDACAAQSGGTVLVPALGVEWLFNKTVNVHGIGVNLVGPAGRTDSAANRMRFTQTVGPCLQIGETEDGTQLDALDGGSVRNVSIHHSGNGVTVNHLMQFGPDGKGGSAHNGALHCTFEHIMLTASGATSACIYVNNGLCISNLFTKFNFHYAPGLTGDVPAIYIRCTDTFNGNAFLSGTIYLAPNYAIHLESHPTGSWAYNNSFKNIDFEVPLNGCVRLLSTCNTTLENLAVWDAFNMTYTQDLFHLNRAGALEDGGWPVNNRLSNITLIDPSPDFAVGKVFINVERAWNTIVQGCGALSGTAAPDTEIAMNANAGHVFQTSTASYTGAVYNFVPRDNPPALGSTVDQLITWMTPPV